MFGYNESSGYRWSPEQSESGGWWAGKWWPPGPPPWTRQGSTDRGAWNEAAYADYPSGDAGADALGRMAFPVLADRLRFAREYTQPQTEAALQGLVASLTPQAQRQRLQANYMAGMPGIAREGDYRSRLARLATSGRDDGSAARLSVANQARTALTDQIAYDPSRSFAATLQALQGSGDPANELAPRKFPPQQGQSRPSFLQSVLGIASTLGGLGWKPF